MKQKTICFDVICCCSLLQDYNNGYVWDNGLLYQKTDADEAKKSTVIVKQKIMIPTNPNRPVNELMLIDQRNS